MAGATIKVRLGLSTTEFDRKLTKSLADVRKFERGLQTMAFNAAVAGAALAVTAGVGFEEGIRGVFDYGSALSELSLRTGAPVKDLMILQTAMKAAGIDGDEAGALINKMQKSIVDAGSDKNLLQMFKKIGLDLAEIKRQSPVQQFQSITNALRNTKDAATRAQVAIDIFGRGGAAVLQIAAGDLQDAAAFIGTSGDILARRADDFDRASDMLHRVPDKFRQFFAGVGDKVIDSLLPAIELFDKYDPAPFGQRVGTALATGLNVFRTAIEQGRFGELFGATLDYGVQLGLDAMATGWQKLVEFIGIGIDKLFSVDMVEAIGGIGNFLSATLIDAFKEAVSYWAALLITETMGAVKAIRSALKTGIGGAAAASSMGGQTSKPDFQLVQTTIKSFLDAMAQTQKGFAKTAFQDVFKFSMSGDLTAARKRWEDLIKTLNIPATPGQAGKKTGTVEGEPFNAPDSGSFSKFDAIRKVGGGGAGILGTDRMQSIAQSHLDEAKKQTDLLKNLQVTTIRVY